MTYATLVERMGRTTPVEFTLGNRALSQAIQLDTKGLMLVAGLHSYALAASKLFAGAQNICGPSAETVAAPSLVENYERLRTMAAKIEDNIARLREIGAVEMAEAYLEPFRQLEEIITEVSGLRNKNVKYNG